MVQKKQVGLVHGGGGGGSVVGILSDFFMVLLIVCVKRTEMRNKKLLDFGFWDGGRCAEKDYGFVCKEFLVVSC